MVAITNFRLLSALVVMLLSVMSVQATEVAAVATSVATAAEVATIVEEHRELQSSGVICDAIIAALFAGNFSCTCDIQPLQGVELFCSRGPICGPSGRVCAGFGVGVGFSLIGGGDVSSDICLQDLTIAVGQGFTFQDFCIDFQINILEDIIGALCPDGIVACLTDGGAPALEGIRTGIVGGCTITADGTQCNSCTPCDDEGGITFDCSNVRVGLTVDRCTKFRPWTGVGSTVKAKIPRIIPNN